MPKEKYLFIDFDDTLSDMTALYLQYSREIGAILAPEYGGEIEDWAKSAIEMLQAMQREYEARFVGHPLTGYCDWLDAAHARSVETLFGKRNLPVPPNPRQLAIETQFHALTSCDAAFPGACDALQILFENDVRVQLASANESEFLLAALMGAGIESYTESKFGPDLVDCAKEGPEFYERIFAATGISAAETLVVDDHPLSIGWAMQAGAKVIQAKLAPERPFDTVPGVMAVLTDLRDLPGLITKHL